jgi:hypothetical protein
MKIESKIGKSASSDQEVYKFISNFHNFKDTCSLQIKYQAGNPLKKNVVSRWIRWAVPV